MTGYSTEGWGDLFLASAGATAALSGLIFVGLSVNLKTVLDFDRQDGRNLLTGRALEALVALLNVLAISIVGLTPSINRGVLAAFILLVAAESAISPVRAARVNRGRADTAKGRPLRMVFAVALTLTLVLAGTTLAADGGGGLLWLPAAFVLAVLIAAVNAWVLLVEVLR